MRNFIDVYRDVEIIGQSTHIGTTRSYFAGFEYNDAHQYRKLFSQRFKLLLGHSVERDVTHLFTHVTAGKTVMVQFMSNDIFVILIHDGKQCAVYAEQSKFGVFTRNYVKQTAPLNSLARRSTNPSNANVTFNIYKLKKFYHVSDPTDPAHPIEPAKKKRKTSHSYSDTCDVPDDSNAQTRFMVYNNTHGQNKRKYNDFYLFPHVTNKRLSENKLKVEHNVSSVHYLH